MKEGFAALAVSDIERGRRLLALAATEGNHYAQMLLARARFHGYYGLAADKKRALSLMYYVAQQGYAPAAAECLSRLSMTAADYVVLHDCITRSGNLYALGVLQIMTALQTGDEEGQRRGQLLIEHSAQTNGSDGEPSELAAAEATWSGALQLRASSLGFADAQLACGQIEAAARHHYTPALLASSSVAHFARGVMQRLCEVQDVSGLTCMEEWSARFDGGNAGERYTLGKLASTWMLPYYEARSHYQRIRASHAHLVGCLMVALRSVPAGRQIGRDMVRLLGQHLWRALDAAAVEDE
jgi:TPR repeat protein